MKGQNLTVDNVLHWLWYCICVSLFVIQYMCYIGCDTAYMLHWLCTVYVLHWLWYCIYVTLVVYSICVTLVVILHICYIGCVQYICYIGCVQYMCYIGCDTVYSCLWTSKYQSNKIPPSLSLKIFLEDKVVNIPGKRKCLSKIVHCVTYQKFKQWRLTILKTTVLILKRGDSYPRDYNSNLLYIWI